MSKQSRKDIVKECERLKATLLKKNKAYGDSALNPVRIFSKAPPDEQLKVRLDDKLSRILRGEETDKVPEDINLDLAGYLVLLQIAQDRDKKKRKRKKKK